MHGTCIVHLDRNCACHDDDQRSGGRDRQPDENDHLMTATICVEGMHNLYVSWTRGQVQSIRWEEQCDCSTHRLDTPDEPRPFAYTLYEDGDSGMRKVCFGNYHFEFFCGEFGMGWDPSGTPTPCDGSCRAPLASLPKFVFKVVRAFLESSGRSWVLRM